MQVKNKSETRPYYVGTSVIAPGLTVTVDDKYAADIKDIDDLEVVKEKAAKAVTKDAE